MCWFQVNSEGTQPYMNKLFCQAQYNGDTQSSKIISVVAENYT